VERLVHDVHQSDVRVALGRERHPLLDLCELLDGGEAREPARLLLTPDQRVELET
jgi:hypothetical protein